MKGTKLTKIVATIGPASETEDQIGRLIDAGVDVFRFNTKHSTPEWHEEHIRLVQSVANRKGSTVGILLDLQGPEIRLETRDKETVVVEVGQKVKIGLSFVEGVQVIIPHKIVFEILKPGDELLIDDGFVETEVLEVTEDSIIVEVKNDSVIKHRKGVNLPGKDIDFPAMIENDIRQLDKNARSKVDYIGLSFVRSAKDILLLRGEMKKRGMEAKIVAKIENQAALDRIDEIIDEADVIMVARGDLGVEVPIEQLAYWQKSIIEKCRVAAKPVITATQMLESMIQNPRPTRAEVTDVANAILDGTDAIMLSAECASGKYPVRSVETMSKIAKWNEHQRSADLMVFFNNTVSSVMAAAAVSVVRSSMERKVDSIVVFTETGASARTIARYRLDVPVIAVTASEKVAEAMAVSYGITPVVINMKGGKFTTPKVVFDELVKREILDRGDLVVVVHGSKWYGFGMTNAVQVSEV
jgi:pyruvate kinase